MENNTDFINQLEKELISRNMLNGRIDREALSKIDVVGFDVDHTLSIYNNENLAELLYNSFISFLINQKGYPGVLHIHHEGNKSIEGNKFTVEKANELSTVEVTIDIKNGNVLRLDEEKVIFKAFHGLRELTEDELVKLYGEDKKFHIFDYETKTTDYMHVMTFFEFHLIPIYLFCIELYEDGLLPNVTSYQQVMNDINESLTYNFGLMDTEKSILKKIDSSGYFFPEIYKNPKKYLHPYNAKDLLIYLKSLGKGVFIVTNSYHEYADFILRNTVGEDYLDYIDLCFYFSKKPSFFKTGLSNGYILGLDKPDRRGLNVTHSCIKGNDEIYQSLRKNKVLIEGNYKLIEEFYQREFGKEKVKFLFFGDNFNSDCLHSGRIENWSSVAVYEHIETGKIGKIPKDFAKLWEEGCEGRRDLFVKIIRENTLFTISNVDALRYFK
jgi:HAD superfamily 5'-nucleotidase-like hydrolase